MFSALPAVAVVLCLLVLDPSDASPFHSAKRWVLVVGAVLGVLLTLRRAGRWQWTALPLVALATLQPWRRPESALQTLAFAWALVAWPALEPKLEQTLRLLWIPVGLSALVVVLQALGLDPLAFAAPDAGTGRLRLYGTLGNPDFVASALLPLLFLAPRLGGKRALVLLGVGLLALASTRSLGTLLAFLAGASAWWLVRGWEKGRFTAAVGPSPTGSDRPGGASSGALILGAALVLALPLLSRDVRSAVAGRAYLLEVAAPHVLDAPLLGHGAGAVQLDWPAWELAHWQARCTDAACVEAHPQGRFAGLQDHVHADPLEWLLERGVLGLLALALALAVPLRAAWRHDPWLLAALVAALTRSLIDFPLARPADLAVLALLCALALRPPQSAAAVAR